MRRAMSCCGKGRANLRARTAAVRPQRPVSVAPPPPVQPPAPPADGELAIEYAGLGPVLVRGSTSGRTYAFSPARRVRNVAIADAEQLLLTAAFTQRH